MWKKKFKKQHVAFSVASVFLLGSPYLAQPVYAAQEYTKTAEGDYASDLANEYDVEQTNSDTLTYRFAAGDHIKIRVDDSVNSIAGSYTTKAYGMNLGIIDGGNDYYFLNPGNNKFMITVDAYGNPVNAGQANAGAEVIASGIFIDPDGVTNKITADLGSNTTINVNAYGSKNVTTNGYYSRNDIEASGIMLVNESTLTIGDNLQVNVNAYGGELTATATTAREQINAYGIVGMVTDFSAAAGGLFIGDNARINVLAQGGKLTGDDGYRLDSDVRAYGLHNADSVGDNAVINVIAKGGQITGDKNSKALTRAIGVYSYDMNDFIDFQGSVTIYTEAVAGTVNGQVMDPTLLESDYNEPYTGSYAIWADNGTVNINQSGGNAVKLTGNIFTKDYATPGLVNVKLDTPDSYWRPTGSGKQRSSFGVQDYTNEPLGGTFEISNGATLDMAWWNNRNGNSYSPAQARELTIYGNAVIGDGANFLINSDVDNSVADSITFSHVKQVSGNQYVKVAYDPKVETLGVITSDQRFEAGTPIDILKYTPYKSAALDGTVVSGQMTTIDAALLRYNVTPEVEYDAVTGQTKLVALLVTGSELIDQGIDASTGRNLNNRSVMLAETPMTASDAQLAMRGLWTTELNSMMRRLGDLRLKSPYNESGVWTRGFGGKVKGDGAYGRNFSQSYGGFQIGYDREFVRETGTYYLGAFYNYIHSSPKYYRGDGKANNNGIGIYGSWLSDRGHYTDIVLRASKLSNKYNLVDLSGNYVDSDYSTWAYGLSVEYGYRKEMKENWFYEPQAELALGRINSQNYTTSNGVNINQSGVNTFTGRLGVLFGRYYGRNNNANAYVKASVLRDFSSKGKIDAAYNGVSQRIDSGSGFGTVFELNLGTNINFNNNSDFYLELTKQFGGDMKLDWQINAGIRFNW